MRTPASTLPSLLAFALLSVAVAPAKAQRMADARVAMTAASEASAPIALPPSAADSSKRDGLTPGQRRFWSALAGSFTGAVAGLFIGGTLLPERVCCTAPEFKGIYLGVLVGGTIGATLGAAGPPFGSKCTRARRLSYALVGAIAGETAASLTNRTIAYEGNFFSFSIVTLGMPALGASFATSLCGR